MAETLPGLSDEDRRRAALEALFEKAAAAEEERHPNLRPHPRRSRPESTKNTSNSGCVSPTSGRRPTAPVAAPATQKTGGEEMRRPPSSGLKASMRR